MELKIIQASRWGRWRAYRALYRMHRERCDPYRVDPYIIKEIHTKLQVSGPVGPLTFTVSLEPCEAALVLHALSPDPANLLAHLGQKRIDKLIALIPEGNYIIDME